MLYLKIGDVIRAKILNKELPRYIYKYTKINKNLYNSLSESYIYFSNYKYFNDPFDCQIKVNTDVSFDELYEYFKSLNGISNFDSSFILKRSKEIYNSNKNEINNLLNETLNNIVSRLGVTCFSLNYKKILLWSHYSNHHTGVCIKYDLYEIANNDFVPFYVKYKNMYPIFNFIKDKSRKHELAKIVLGTKFIDWEYEEEFRIVSYKKEKNKINPKGLLAIYFGVNSKKYNVKRIKNLIINNKNYINVKFYKGELMNNRFGIKFSQI